MPAPPERDRAECAAVIAPLAHLEVADVSRTEGQSFSRMYLRRPVQESASVELRRQPVDISQAEEQVHLGEGNLQLRPVSLDHAPDGDHASAISLPLQASRLEQGLDRLLFRRVDEAAGVDEDHLGLAQILDPPGALPDQLPEQAFYMVGNIDEAVEKAKDL